MAAVDTRVRAAQTVAAVAVATGLALGIGQPFGLDPQAAWAAGLSLAAIGLWATGVLAEHVTALLFLVLAMVLGVAPASVVFSGFHSTAVWLVFGGLIVGVAVKATGLADRLAHLIARHLPDRSYAGIIFGVVFLGVALSFLMPSSMGRIVVLLPIIMALAGRYGFAAGSSGHTGMALATAFAAYLPPFAILPANVPNMVLIGASETLYGIVPVYGAYLAMHFPLLGLAKAVVIAVAVILIFPDRPRPPQDGEAPSPPMTARERLMAVILAVALGLWVLDFLHGLSPAWIGLGAGAVCLLPGFNLLPKDAFNKQINYESVFYIAGVMGLGAVIAETGVGDVLAARLLEFLDPQPGAPFTAFLSMAGLTSLMGLVTTLPPAPAIVSPLAGEFASASGLPLASVLMMQVVGFSVVWLPYQAPPLVVAMQLAGIPLARTVSLTLSVALVSALVLAPLDFLWWRLLGYLPG